MYKIFLKIRIAKADIYPYTLSFCKRAAVYMAKESDFGA
jgi:hypothetical protein